MIALPDLVAAAMLAVLLCYCVSGGADFGAGVWDLLARGPRGPAQRRLIEQAIAPIWEANHVWLIFLVVLLFTAFPSAFSAASIALYVPLSLALLGIVIRGAGFVFRQYGVFTERVARRWGRAFALSSLLVPFFLGVTLAALTTGHIHVVDGVPVALETKIWLNPFTAIVGCFVIVLFAFLAAVYLTNETPDRALQDDFRARALGSGILCGVLAFAAKWMAREGHFRNELLFAPRSLPFQIAVGAIAIAALVAIGSRKYRLARILAIVQVALVAAGWGVAQRPYLIAPDVTISGAAAPRATLIAVLSVAAAGLVVLVPSLWKLYRIFKARLL